MSFDKDILGLPNLDINNIFNLPFALPNPLFEGLEKMGISNESNPLTEGINALSNIFNFGSLGSTNFVSAKDRGQDLKIENVFSRRSLGSVSKHSKDKSAKKEDFDPEDNSKQTTIIGNSIDTSNIKKDRTYNNEIRSSIF